jgi:hypothetical protein
MAESDIFQVKINIFLRKIDLVPERQNFEGNVWKSVHGVIYSVEAMIFFKET